jgi:hypothetical protein
MSWARVPSPMLMQRPLSYLWAAPCTAFGLGVAGMLSLFLGARCAVVDGVLEVWPSQRTGVAARLLHRAPFAAITFGHVVLGASLRDLELLRAHEHAHVRQYERWGLLFFVAYPAASLWQGVAGRRPYRDNPFEVQARIEAALPVRPR